MRKDIRRFVETELEFYHKTKKEYESFKDDLISTKNLEMSQTGGGKTYSISNPTQNNAVRLICNNRLKRMEEIIRAIEKTLEGLDKDKKKFIKIKYWSNKKYTMDGVAMELRCEYDVDVNSTKTLYNWKRKICEQIAFELGLIN